MIKENKGDCIVIVKGKREIDKGVTSAAQTR